MFTHSIEADEHREFWLIIYGANGREVARTRLGSYSRRDARKLAGPIVSRYASLAGGSR